MPDISRLHPLADGEVVEASTHNEEYNQLIAAVNDRVEADTTLWADLYAERLHDGSTSYPVNAAGGTNNIPVCNSGTIQVGLNADLLDGSHLSDILDAGFDTGTKMLFYQSAAPGGWSIVTAPATHRAFGWRTGKTGGTNSSNTDWGSSLVAEASVVVNPHTLLLSEIPSHNHLASNGLNGVSDVFFTAVQSGSGESVLDGTIVSPATKATGSSGGDGQHDHTASFLVASGWEPPISWCIVCTKL